MTSVENFRGFINEILNAAAEEIFRCFRNAVVEEIDRLRRRGDLVSKPEEIVYNTEILLQNVHLEVVGIDPQLMKQESSSVDQHDPEPQQIKDEQEEPSVSQKEEHLEPKQEADAFMLTLASEGSGCGEELSEKRQDHSGRKQKDTGPTKDPEPKLKILPQNIHIEVVSIDPQLMKQESSSVDQHDPEPPQVKDEQEEPSVSQKEEHLEPTQEADAFMLTLASEGSGCGEELSEKRQDHSGRKQKDTGPTKDPEPKLSKTHCRFNKKCKSVISNTRHYFDARKKPSKCNPWAKYLGYASELHLRQHSGEKLHLCEICGKRSDYKSTRDKHVSIHAGDNLDPCQRACHLKLDVKSQTTHTAEKPQSGPMCGEQFGSARVLKAQLKTHSGEKPFLCKTCGERFADGLGLENHVTIHTGEKPYACHTCGQSFSCSSVLKSHLSVHTGEEPYSCQDCGECFTVKSALMSHLSIHNVDKPFFCKTRGKRFANRSVLQSHTIVHTDEKPFLCNICGKRFANKSLLESHAEIHTGDKPYSCDTCGRKFRRSSELNSHLRVHTGQKPFPCNTCGRSFSRTQLLKSHLRVHTGEKPYSCKECGKCFTVSSTLVNHMRIHTGEKPYSCKECGKRFTVQCNLIRHQRIHMGKEPYTCETSGKDFKNAGDLKGHITRKH